MKASNLDPVIRNKFSRPVNPMAVGLDWGRRGFHCRQMRDPPGQEWRDFVHDADELVLVLKGRLEISLAGHIIEAEEGDEVFIAGGAVHTVRNAATATTIWLYGYAGGKG
ncbi:MAG: cupin domain-containing protein [Alphaproteobacteria bacterium]